MKSTLKSAVMLTAAMFAWGSLYPVSKILMSDIHPLTLSFLRYFFGILPLIPFYIIQKKKTAAAVPVKDHLILFFLGILGITLFALFLFIGLSRSSGANGSLLANTQPVFAALLAPLLIREKITPSKVVGILLGLAGIILVTSGSEPLKMESYLRKGTLLLLGAALSMTVYNVYLQRLIRSHGGLTSTFLTMVWGALCLLVIVALGPAGLRDLRKLDSLRELLLIIYLGAAATTLPYLLFNKALGLTDVITASGYKFLIPVSGVTLSVILLGETLSFYNIIGIAIVLFSVIYLQKKERKVDLRG